mgnify:CR=1 FL=1
MFFSPTPQEIKSSKEALSAELAELREENDRLNADLGFEANKTADLKVTHAACTCSPSASPSPSSCSASLFFFALLCFLFFSSLRVTLLTVALLRCGCLVLLAWRAEGGGRDAGRHCDQ